MDTFLRLISTVQDDLLLISPFIKIQSTEQLLSGLQKRGMAERVRVSILTNLRPESALNGSMDLEALLKLSRNLPQFELTHLPSLHAKVYVADSRMAVVTSGNLTPPGISGNLEYGVAFVDEQTVRQIRHDFEGYALLGARIQSRDIEVLVRETSELIDAFKRAERSIRTEARRAFREKLRAAHVQLLRHRARGTTTQSILSDTILFLLERAPLRTTELHPLIQRLHPDICDDSIDRVIDGVNFGKRWKHYVRNAQQFLKRTGRIHYDGERWRLVSRT
jgi:phosphatidylserine/phosphatidylglycerophosphate/cardiolipin synthase-like enzyme